MADGSRRRKEGPRAQNGAFAGATSGRAAFACRAGALHPGRRGTRGMVRRRVRARRAAGTTLRRRRHRNQRLMAGCAARLRGRRLPHARNGHGAWHRHGRGGRHAGGGHHLSRRRRLWRCTSVHPAGLVRPQHRRGSRSARLHRQRPGLSPCARAAGPFRRGGRPRSRRPARGGRPAGAFRGGRAAHPARLPLRLAAGFCDRGRDVRRPAVPQAPAPPASPQSASRTSWTASCAALSFTTRSCARSTCWRPCCPTGGHEGIRPALPLPYIRRLGAYGLDSAPCAPRIRFVRWAALFHDVGKPASFFVGENGVGRTYGHAAIGVQVARGAFQRLRLPSAFCEPRDDPDRPSRRRPGTHPEGGQAHHRAHGGRSLAVRGVVQAQAGRRVGARPRLRGPRAAGRSAGRDAVPGARRRRSVLPQEAGPGRQRREASLGVPAGNAPWARPWRRRSTRSLTTRWRTTPHRSPPSCGDGLPSRPTLPARARAGSEAYPFAFAFAFACCRSYRG